MRGRTRLGAITAVGLALAGASGALGFSTLKGSHEKMVRQNTVAHEDHFQFAQTPDDIARLAAAHQLVPLPGSADYSTKGVSFALARPPVLSFVERLAYEYHSTCGQPMEITSLVRPVSLQPHNASPLSVHPAGMAVDLHVPDPPACRAWLVQRLLTLASYNVLDVTEEMHPHHLHVAVFPNAYTAWAAKQPPVPVAGPAPTAGAPAPVPSSRPAAAGLAFPRLQDLDVPRTLAAVATTVALMGLAGLAVVRPLRARAARRKAHGESRRA